MCWDALVNVSPCSLPVDSRIERMHVWKDILFFCQHALLFCQSAQGDHRQDASIINYPRLGKGARQPLGSESPRKNKSFFPKNNKSTIF